MKSAGYKNLLNGRAAIGLLLAIGAVALFPAAPVQAQDASMPTKEVNITLNEAPVRTALDTLFKSAGLNYTIDPSVTGLVTVSLRAIPFDVALRSILRSAEPPLAFTVEDGVYNIHPRVETIDIQNAGDTETPTTPAATTDTTTDTTADDQSTATQVVPLRLEYANAQLILRYALGGGKSGYIPSLDAPPTTNRGGTGGGGGLTGGGMTGGFGGGMTGGMSGGGMSGGMSGGMMGGGMTGGMTGGGFNTGGY